MTGTDSAAPASPRLVRFGRRSSRGVLLGLSGPRVVAVAAAFVVAVPAVYAAGGTGMLVALPLWAGLVAAAVVPVAGQPAVEWVPVAGTWAWRRAHGQTVYGARILHPRPAGSLALPGDATALRHYRDDVLGAALVHDPYAKTLAASLRVRHPSFVLLCGADQDRRVAGWARVYAACCQSGRISRVQVLEQALPDDGHGVVDFWKEHGVHDTSWAATTYEQVVQAAGPGAQRHTTTISVSLDLTKARRAIRAHGGGIAGAAAVLRGELALVISALQAADIVMDGWLDVDDLALVLRLAYDPAATHLERTGVGRRLETAGPLAVVEHWDHLRSDSGAHAVYWISEWPRCDVLPSFLTPLLLTPGVRRAVSIVARPLSTAEAVKAIRRERVEYQTDAAHRSRIGQLSDPATEQEWADVTERERDLVAGHGDLRFAGFVAVTAADLDALQAAQAAIEQAALQSGCELRLLVGQQAQAFTAAVLPLCRGL